MMGRGVGICHAVGGDRAQRYSEGNFNAVVRGQLRQATVKHRESHVSGGRDPAAAQNKVEPLDVARAGVGQNGEK